jgi:hypothetical protein
MRKGKSLHHSRSLHRSTLDVSPIDMLRSAWNQKAQLISDIFRKKSKPVRNQQPPGPSNLSSIYNATDIGDASDIEYMEQQTEETPVLPDTVALVRTPEQIDDLELETLLPEDPNSTQTSPAQHNRSLNSPAHSQQSLESPHADGKKSGRMNRLITKLRHHKRD